MYRLRRLMQPVSDLTTRLWVRLSIAFAFVVLLGVVTTTFIGIAAFATNQDSFDMAAAFNMKGGPVDVVRSYMHQHPDGSGLSLLLRGLQSAYPQDESSISITFSYETEDGQVVFDSHPKDTEPWPYDYFEGTFPIRVEGEVVGYLHIKRMTAFEDWEPRDAFFNWLRSDFGIVAIVGAGIGIMAGVIISRAIAEPLRRLADGARRFGQRHFNRRVEMPQGVNREVAQVASAFNDMADQMHQSESLRRGMVADVAHELRTPLSVLQGNLRALLDGVYPMDRREISNLYDQTRVLSRLVNDLHDLARAEAHQLPMDFQPVDLVALVRRITSTFEPLCHDQDITLTTDLPDEPITVSTDTGRLSQVFNNLLSNALHHTPAGGHITIRAGVEAENVRITVQDTGSGIPADHLPYIFERFYRADPSRSRESGGAGLGLAIVKAIVEEHGGTISVSSPGTPGAGTTFTLHLPCERR